MSLSVSLFIQFPTTTTTSNDKSKVRHNWLQIYILMNVLLDSNSQRIHPAQRPLPRLPHTILWIWASTQPKDIKLAKRKGLLTFVGFAIDTFWVTGAVLSGCKISELKGSIEIAIVYRSTASIKKEEQYLWNGDQVVQVRKRNGCNVDERVLYPEIRPLPLNVPLDLKSVFVIDFYYNRLAKLAVVKVMYRLLMGKAEQRK